jgi:hypothetical protein
MSMMSGAQTAHFISPNPMVPLKTVAVAPDKPME